MRHPSCHLVVGAVLGVARWCVVLEYGAFGGGGGEQGASQSEDQGGSHISSHRFR